jgi:hypothetical protein
MKKETDEQASDAVGLLGRKWWKISVTGYGAFGFYGTHGEAEEMRRHKANWEGGCGRKEEIPKTDKLAVDAAEWTREQIERGTVPSEREQEEANAA